jgi:hypothetical protein
MQQLILKMHKSCVVYFVIKIQFLQRIQEFKQRGLISYHKTNGITSFKKHVDANHMFIANKLEEEVIYLVKQIEERHLAKKYIYITNGSISKNFILKDSFQKEGVPQKEFLNDLSLLIVKNNLPIQFVESMWPKLNFPSRKQFSQETLRRLVEKTKQLHILLALAKCHFATSSFDLWMSKGA